MTAWLALLAGVVFVVGLVLSIRLAQPRKQAAGVLATAAATVVVGWIAWYSGIQV